LPIQTLDTELPTLQTANFSVLHSWLTSGPHMVQLFLNTLRQQKLQKVPMPL